MSNAGFYIALGFLVLGLAGAAYLALSAIYRGVRSRIYMSEGIDNADRRFGADTRYYPAYVQVSGKWEPALFTRHELHEACERAADNSEDIAPMEPWWQWMVRRG